MLSKLHTPNWFTAFRGSRCPELLRLHKPEGAQHLVQFYEDECFIIENVSFLTLQTLDAGDSSVVVATEPHLHQIRERLFDFGIDADAFQRSGQYVAVEAGEALSRFMVHSWPYPIKFDETIGELLSNTERNSAHGFVFAFGEMVALLCAANNPQAAIRLEQLWNGLAERRRFSLYCAYSLSSLGHNLNADALLQICSEHALTIPTETSL
jgi:MEDS: MEthanogen/methylotroph, DcmR Sensory domain